MIDLDLVREYGPYIARGAVVTIQLALASMAVALPIGLIGALMLLSGRRWLAAPARLYVEVIRGTPSIVVLFLIYFGLAGNGFVLSPFAGATTALGVLGGAFCAEIFRGAIEGVPVGQREAAHALGMDYRVMMRRVVLPQAMRLSLPPLTNTFVQLLKDTSLVVTIGVADITYRAYNVATSTYRAMPVYMIAAVIYLAMAWPASIGVRRLEARLDRGRVVKK
ncbi:MAG: amino acid ABC transporter permease [Acidimicrobiales bacterium]|nr:amino acid ABC transporter permease [Acidimicrobiales bacterium]